MYFDHITQTSDRVLDLPSVVLLLNKHVTKKHPLNRKQRKPQCQCNPHTIYLNTLPITLIL